MWETSVKQVARRVSSWLLAKLFLKPEDGGEMFFRNVG
jgi:hypothetical protein